MYYLRRFRDPQAQQDAAETLRALLPVGTFDLYANIHAEDIEDLRARAFTSYLHKKASPGIPARYLPDTALVLEIDGQTIRRQARGREELTLKDILERMKFSVFRYAYTNP